MAAFQFPVSKLEIINSALLQCGDNVVNAADDGSDEWNVGSTSYERALAYVIESHDWSWTTDVRTLQPSPTAPDDDYFDTAYALPADLVHLILVRVNDLPCVWDLLNNQIVVNAQGGPPAPSIPTTPAAVTIKGIFSTNSDSTFATPTVVLVLQAMVMSGIYRGLHEDVGQAERMWNSGKALLAEAKARHDTQKPKRALFNSRITMARRIRRPWPLNPGGWGNIR
jgi:hypothetical protein